MRRALPGLLLALLVTSIVTAQGRLGPPPFVTCDRNQLTSFTGRVVSLSRGADATRLVMDTDESTREQLTIRHPKGDASAWFYRAGQPFVAQDWAVLLPAGRLRPDARATAWVCSTQTNPRIDWALPATDRQ